MSRTKTAEPKPRQHLGMKGQRVNRRRTRPKGGRGTYVRACARKYVSTYSRTYARTYLLPYVRNCFYDAASEGAPEGGGSQSKQPVGAGVMCRGSLPAELLTRTVQLITRTIALITIQ